MSFVTVSRYFTPGFLGFVDAETSVRDKILFVLELASPINYLRSFRDNVDLHCFIVILHLQSYLDLQILFIVHICYVKRL
jgi:hypothetical protein